MSIPIPPAIEALFDKYFSRTIEPEELAQLEAWLAESPEHADAFARAGLAHGLTREVVKKQVAALRAKKKSILFSPMALIAASAILVVGLGIMVPMLGVAKKNVMLAREVAPAANTLYPAVADADGDVGGVVGGRGISTQPVAGKLAADISKTIGADGKAAESGPSSLATSPAAPVILRTAALRLRADDAHAIAQKIEALATSLGGFTSRSESQGEAHQAASAHVEIRVPAAALDQARAQVRALGSVLADSTAATEVGDQLVDLAARIANLETAEKELRQIVSHMSDRTDKTSDLMVAYRELTEVRSQIEVLKAQEKNLKDRVALSSLAVDVFEEAPPPTTPEGWSALRPFQSAWTVLVSLAQSLWNLGAYLLVVGVPVVAAVGFPAWIIYRARKRKD